MNNRSYLFLSLTALVFASAPGVRAQTPAPSQVYTRPRVVSVAQQPQPTPSAQSQNAAPRQGTQPAPAARQNTTATPAASPSPNVQSSPSVQPSTPAQQSPFAQPPASSATQFAVPYRPLLPARPLSVNKFRERVAEAERMLKSRLTLTAMTPNTAFVTIAALDQDSSQIHTLSVPKDMFLQPGADVVLTTAQGLNVRLQVVRTNYVNTAVVVSEAATGRQLTPRVVEHVDHDRFRREDRTTLYNEVYSLFALNELDTYRYSVSSAGAGGMVQMIAPTYQMVRGMHPGVGLNPDFVAGMRNHGNALEAMLLYMQDTWNGLAFNQDVQDALSAKTATQAELVAAGYNSNPAHLPQYLPRRR